jgi:hypothetical protein
MQPSGNMLSTSARVNSNEELGCTMLSTNKLTKYLQQLLEGVYDP